MKISSDSGWEAELLGGNFYEIYSLKNYDKSRLLEVLSWMIAYMTKINRNI